MLGAGLAKLVGGRVKALLGCGDAICGLPLIFDGFRKADNERAPLCFKTLELGCVEVTPVDEPVELCTGRRCFFFVMGRRTTSLFQTLARLSGFLLGSLTSSACLSFCSLCVGERFFLRD